VIGRTLSLNDQVTFRMTTKGERLWRQYIRNLLLEEADYVKHEYTWPLWEVMTFFGPHLRIGLHEGVIQDNEIILRDS
jgi:hypothetical protein